jgi:flagella basal body P-ring formation protein FlgA
MIRSLVILMLAAVGLTAAAAVAQADVITLRSDAKLPAGAIVKLGDIATFEGPAAEALADVELGPVRPAIRLSEVRTLLETRGTNFARISLRGALIVSINGAATATPATADTAAAQAAADASAGGSLMSNPQGDVRIHPTDAQPGTLRARLLAHLLDHLNLPHADVKVAFDSADMAQLDQLADEGRFELDPVVGDGVGRVILTVHKIQPDAPAQTIRITAHVTVQRPVVLVTRSLSRGQVIEPQDVEVRTLWLDSMIKPPLSDTSVVIGMRSAGVMRVGSHVHSDDLKTMDLVRRGQMVTVRCVSGQLVIKTVARAMGDAAMGETVMVRNDRTREEFAVRVTGPQEATVMIEGEAMATTQGGQL